MLPPQFLGAVFRSHSSRKRDWSLQVTYDPQSALADGSPQQPDSDDCDNTWKRRDEPSVSSASAPRLTPSRGRPYCLQSKSGRTHSPCAQIACSRLYPAVVRDRWHQRRRIPADRSISGLTPEAVSAKNFALSRTPGAANSDDTTTLSPYRPPAVRI